MLRLHICQARGRDPPKSATFNETYLTGVTGIPEMCIVERTRISRFIKRYTCREWKWSTYLIDMSSLASHNERLHFPCRSLNKDFRNLAERLRGKYKLSISLRKVIFIANYFAHYLDLYPEILSAGKFPSIRGWNRALSEGIAFFSP